MPDHAVAIELVMKAIMLAAGIGARLELTATEPPPQVLLRFGGKSFLQYHIEILQRHGIDKLVLGVGHKHQDIERKSLPWAPKILSARCSTRITGEINAESDKRFTAG